LKALPIHPSEIRGLTFRSTNSVGRKLADIHTHRPGYTGKPTSGSKLDIEIWKKYGNNAEIVRSIARTIISNHGTLQNPVDEEDEIADGYSEGRIVVRLHRVRERDPRIASRKRKSLLKLKGFLGCEACGINLEETYGSQRFDVYECHHLLPLHMTGETKTKIQDVALLCPTCHRIAHRIVPWPTLDQLKEIRLKQKFRD
jgi:5-methylcytosine-specific restriction enzyme A